MHFNSTVDEIREAVHRDGLVIIRAEQPMDKDDWRSFCQPFGEFMRWDFGDINELILKKDAKNYLYSEQAVPMHWDGAFATAPSLLMFYCIESDGQGGETTFVDTHAILEYATTEEIALWEKLKLHYQTDKVAHYGGRICSSMISKHPHLNMNVLRYAEPVETELNPVHLEIEGLTNEEQTFFVESIRAKLYDKRFCYAHAWKPRDIIIADNHRLLHGRNALEGNVSRHILRIQII